MAGGRGVGAVCNRVEVEVEAMPALVLEPAGAATFRVAGATYRVARGMTARKSPRL